ncbi:hypothetical protein ACWDUI_37485, partial [Streptosporangium sandarakinum]
MGDLRARLARLSPEQRAALEEKLRRKAAPRREEIPPRPEPGGPAPLSFGQERLWFLHQPRRHPPHRRHPRPGRRTAP